MKHLIKTLGLTCISLFGYTSLLQAQQQEATMLHVATPRDVFTGVHGTHPKPYTKTERTRGGSRWYDIIDAIDKDQGGGGTIYNNDNYNILWTDSTMLAPFGSSSGTVYDGVWIKSINAFLDPTDPRYNDVNSYAGAVAMDRSKPHTIDSLFLPYIYNRNPLKPTIVDTLIVSVIKGNGSGTSSDISIRYFGPTSQTAINHATDTLRILHGYLQLTPGASNRFSFIGSTPGNVMTTKIPLTATTENDTLSNGFNYFEIPVNMNMAPGELAGVSVTFKSGDTWTPFLDTLYQSGATSVNFNHFRFVAFEENVGAYQTYYKGYYSQSGIMRNDTSGWGNWHIPSYAFTNTSYEHHWFSWKITCATCGAVGVNDLAELAEVRVYPVPAHQQIQLELKPASSLNQVYYTLQNINGQELRRASLGNLDRSGVNTFQIPVQDLPNGLYVLNVHSREGTLHRKVSVQHH